ncbi:MAG: exonuclease SbcCD subunit D C-terminal domain-containing protein [Oliverpabstia sp.]
MEEILEANKDRICEDYVSIVLTDEEELYQPKEQLERIFTHILEVRTERNRKLVQEWGRRTGRGYAVRSETGF